MLPLNKLTLLHSIRGLAAFYVVVAHAKFPLWSGGQAYLEKFPRESWGIMDYVLFALDMSSSNGSAMVIIFYVLSGFFIAYSFDKNQWSLKNFYINRSIRIYIPYLFSMVFAIGVLVFLSSVTPEVFNIPLKSEFLTSLKESFELVNFKSVLLGLFFLPNDQYIGFNFPYWSLLYEGIFYLIAPFVVRYPKSYLGVSTLALLIPIFIPLPLGNPFVRFIFEFCFYFALGINTYYFIKDTAKPGWLKANYLIISLLLLFPAFVVIGVGGYHRLSFVFAGLFGAGLIYLFVNFQITDNFFIKFFKKMGMISYTMYLFHFPILILTFGLLFLFTGQYFFYNRIYWIGVLVAVVLSFPIYYLVEEKSLKLIALLKKKKGLVVK